LPERQYFHNRRSTTCGLDKTCACLKGRTYYYCPARSGSGMGRICFRRLRLHLTCGYENIAFQAKPAKIAAQKKI
jgi:hypothetical protein